VYQAHALANTKKSKSVPNLPSELATFTSLVDAQPEPVRAAFHYCLTLVMMEAAGCQPWALAIRGGGKDTRMERPLRMVSVEPSVTAVLRNIAVKQVARLTAWVLR
jgi:hypothetical protein